MITYKDGRNSKNSLKTKILVRLDGKLVGYIHNVYGGYKYYPVGDGSGGETFSTVSEVKKSLEVDG
tara:strand:- start:32212 stop:32409 length:198 start_codon:yes stop_codon:yes gene_type:complete